MGTKKAGSNVGATRKSVKVRKRMMLFVPIARPMYSQAASISDKLKLRIYDARYDPYDIYPRYYAIADNDVIEPHYIPSRLPFVEILLEDRAALIAAAGHVWGEPDFSWFARAIERTLLSIAYDFEKPRARSLMERLGAVQEACKSLGAALGSKDVPSIHRAILQDDDVIEHYLSPKVDLDDLKETLSWLALYCQDGIDELKPIVTAPGKKADLAFDALLVDIIQIFKRAKLPTTLPFNESSRKPTALSAVAREVSRITSRRGVSFLNGPGGGKRFFPMRHILEPKMRAYENRTDLAIVKALRKVLARKPKIEVAEQPIGFWVDQQAFFKMRPGRDPDDPRPSLRSSKVWKAPKSVMDDWD